MRYPTLVSLLAAGALAAGCGVGTLPPITGTPDNDRTTADVTEVRGVVERIDTAARRIVIEVDDPRDSNLRDGDTATLYYATDTPVEYRDQVYRPTDLEAGDRIAAELDARSDRLDVTRIEVLYDSTDASDRAADRDDGAILDDERNDSGVLDDERDSETAVGAFEADLRGTVREINRSARTMRIEATRYGTSFDRRGGVADLLEVRWDDRTVVRFEGRRYTAENVENGDLVAIDVRALPGGYVAEEIQVLGESGAGSR